MEHLSGANYIRHKQFRETYLLGWGSCKLVANEKKDLNETFFVFSFVPVAWSCWLGIIIPKREICYFLTIFLKPKGKSVYKL